MRVTLQPKYCRLKHVFMKHSVLNLLEEYVSLRYFLWVNAMYILNKSSKLVLRSLNRRWCSENSDSVVVTRAKAALHVLETSLQAVCRDRVRVVCLDKTLQP